MQSVTWYNVRLYLTSNPNLVAMVAIEVGDVTPANAPRILARFLLTYAVVKMTFGSLSS